MFSDQPRRRWWLQPPARAPTWDRLVRCTYCGGGAEPGECVRYEHAIYCPECLWAMLCEWRKRRRGA